MAKINILVVPSDNQGGVGFYRSFQPHIQLMEQFPDEFSVEFDMNPDFSDLERFDKYDIIHIHKGVLSNVEIFRNAMRYFKSKGIVTILDIDDDWQLHPHHPQYLSQRNHKTDVKIKEGFPYYDYITTTTDNFASILKPFNKNVKVFPNAINPEDPRFKTVKEPTNKIRVGLVMGSSHEYDVNLIDGTFNRLPKDVLDKIQIVLCGFDTRGTMTMIDKETGQEEIRPIRPEETVWCRYEKMVTDNWRVCSPQYKQFLDMYLNVEYPFETQETYRRCWTKDMDHYFEHFNKVDILLAPIEETRFNFVKSPLKCAECCFSHTALIASNYGPYAAELTSAIEFGGKINPQGNALLVDESKNHKDWAKYIEKLVKNPELLEQLKTNIYETLHEKFDLRNVTADRAEFYRSIIKKNKEE